MNDQQLLRYSRQIMLPQVDVEGQQKLLDSKVLILGAGGLGSPAAMYLAAAGVGHIHVFDDDEVDLSNLQRQISHRTQDIGTAKAFSTKKTLFSLNPEIQVSAFQQRLVDESLREAVQAVDLVLDCSDNFKTRFAVNRSCVELKKPLVSGAAIRFEGQIAVFNPQRAESPCYNCLYSESGEEMQTCAQNGVIAPLTGIIGSMQALEAMKIIMAIGEGVVGRLLVLDAMTMTWNSLKLKKNPACPTCGESSFI